MILAIKKIGTRKGFLGLQKIFKCRYPNGGIDHP